MQGRKPKPTIIKLISGNPGGRALPKDEPMPSGDLFAAPSELTPSQAEIWDYAIEHAPVGLLRSLDRDLLKTWACAVDEFNRCEAELSKSSPVILKGGSQRITKFPNGTVSTTTISPMLVVSPWCKARDAADQRKLRATCELGFSPTSRSRITLANPGGSEKTPNRFAKNASGR
jgi:phage terminase small subunit